jgi:hypothetical protein
MDYNVKDIKGNTSFDSISGQEGLKAIDTHNAKKYSN